MNYQICWQDKAKKLPQDILSRLFLDKFKSGNAQSFRVFISGQGSEFMLNAMQSIVSQSAVRIFISGFPAGFGIVAVNPEYQTKAQSIQSDNVVFLKGAPVVHLSSFPANMYDLVVSLWNSLPVGTNDSPQKPDKADVMKGLDFTSYLSNIYRLLKDGGQFCVVTYLDGSPELPLNIFKSIIKRHQDWSLKLFKSTLPGSASEFRKMLYKSGLGDIRVWEDNIICDYQNAEEFYNDIFAMENYLFSDEMPKEYASVIKREFTQELNALSYPVKIAYNFAAATGLVMKS